MKKLSINTPLRVPNDGAFGRASTSVQRNSSRCSTANRGGRQSVLGLIRRSSAHDSRKELRIQIDRQTHPKNIKKLITFLTDKNYPQQISLRNLNSPTTKDVLNIFEFLLSLLSINYPKGKKLEDEFPKILKLLRFPYNIVKHQLQPIGSMHTWPSIVYALNWICNLVEHNERLTKDPITVASLAASADGPNKATEYLFHKNAYIHFMQGVSLEDLAQVDDEFLGQLFSQTGLDQLQELDDKARELDAKREELREELENQKLLQVQVADTERDIEHLNKYLQEMEIYQGNLDQQKQMLQTGNEELKKKMADTNAEIDRLTAVVSNQKVTVEELHHLAAVVESLECEGRSHEEVQKELQNEILATETQLLKQQKEFRDAVENYHAVARKCKLIPISGSNAQGFDYALHIEPGDSTDVTRISSDIDKIKCRLKIVAQQWKEASRELRAKEMKSLSELQQLKAILSAKNQDLVWEQGKLRRLEETKAITEQEYTEKLQRHEAEMAAEEEEIALLTRSAANAEGIQDLEKTVKELHTEFQELEEYKQRRESEVAECQLKVCEVFINLKDAVENKLKDFEAEVIDWCEQNDTFEVDLTDLKTKLQIDVLENEIDNLLSAVSRKDSGV